MRLSIVIPCYNERTTLRTVVEAVRAAIPSVEKEIIIVDDFSTDGTREILAKDITPLVAKVIYHEKNLGKGAALRTGFAAATGDVVVVQDADLEYDPNEFEKLLVPIAEGRADVVYGSRFRTGCPQKHSLWTHYWGNRFLTWVSNIFTGMKLTDMETCYKMFRREVLRKIVVEEPRFGVEPEVTAKVAKLGCRVEEIAISYQGRTHSQGKKIGWKDGFRALWAIAKYNLWAK